MRGVMVNRPLPPMLANERDFKRLPPTFDAGDEADRLPEFAAEHASLRALIERRGETDRAARERAQAQIAEAQAFKRELELIYAAVERSRGAMAAFSADAPDSDRTARTSRELAAIVASTERATQSILQAAEEIDHAAGTLSAALKSGHDKGLAQDIQERVVQIFEACNFQDLTGQRVAHVLGTLKLLEEHTARLLDIWSSIEAMRSVFGKRREGDRRFLNGPKLADDRGHSNQNDIDVMFGRA
jgi:chemotaxis protein CheZ